MEWMEGILGSVDVPNGDRERVDRWAWWVTLAFVALLLESVPMETPVGRKEHFHS
jgi:hypothetical protein